MSSSSSEDSKNGNCSSNATTSHNKYKGIRRRKWGKWISEIRVPGTSERLWLGSYTSPEAAAVAHDVALYCLRGYSSSVGNFNFPSMLPASVEMGMSPAEVQKAASDAGLAIDARLLNSSSSSVQQQHEENGRGQKHDSVGGEVMNWEPSTNLENWDWSRKAHDQHLNISVDDYLQWSNQ